MNFVRRNWIKIALGTGVAICALALYSESKAADLGGNCCSDLEERIAELEATTARKGNRKMSVTVYGEISKGLLFWDADGYNDVAVSENSAAESFIGFKGEAKIDANWKAGFILELGVGGYEYGISLGANTNDTYIRNAAVYLDGTLGRVTLGHYSQATDGIAEISVANTAVASRMLSLRPLNGPPYGDVLDLFDGTRGDLVRYDTPILAGFRASASWASGPEDADVFDVAVRWAGEFSGFRIAAGVGYRDGLVVPHTGIFGVTDQVNVWSGSASVMHMTSGLFVNAAAGQLEIDGFNGKLKGYHGQTGIEQKFFSLGKTTIFVEAAKAEVDGVDEELTLWGAGLVQSIDAAALDLFVNARQIELDDDDALVGMFGARIKF